MSNLVCMKNKQAVTSSLQVADTFAKNHRDVLKVIANLQKDVRNFAQMFSESSIPDSYGRDRKAFYMNRDGFTLLAMGFTGKRALEFKLKYIEAFNEMESTIKDHRIELPQTPMQALQLMFDATKEVDSKVDKVTHRVTDLEDNQTIAPSEYGYISHQVSKAVSEWVRVHPFVTTQQQRAKLYRDISRGLNEVTGVKTRTQLRRKDFDTADEFISNWQPSTATIQIIKQLDDKEDE